MNGITPYQAKKDLDYILERNDISGLIDSESMLIRVLRKEISTTEGIVEIIKAFLSSIVIGTDELCEMYKRYFVEEEEKCQ